MELEEGREHLKEQIVQLKNIVRIILLSTYKPARQITKEEEALLDTFLELARK